MEIAYRAGGEVLGERIVPDIDISIRPGTRPAVAATRASSSEMDNLRGLLFNTLTVT